MSRRCCLVLSLAVLCGGCRSSSAPVPNLAGMTTELPHKQVAPPTSVLRVSADQLADDSGTVPYGFWTRSERDQQTVDLEITPRTIRFCIHMSDETRLALAGDWTASKVGFVRGHLRPMSFQFSSSGDFDMAEADSLADPASGQPFDMEFSLQGGDIVIRTFNGGSSEIKCRPLVEVNEGIVPTFISMGGPLRKSSLPLEGTYRFVRAIRPKADRPLTDLELAHHIQERFAQRQQADANAPRPDPGEGPSLGVPDGKP